MFAVFDPDLVPVWDALAVPSEAEAHFLCSPLFDNVERDVFAAIQEVAFNLADVLALPPHLQALLRCVPGICHYKLRVEALVLDPAGSKRLRDEWEQRVRPRAAAFVIARECAFLAVLDRQRDYAREALARDNLFAARWHIFHLLRHEPSSLPALLADDELAPLHPLLREIADALPAHPHVLDDSGLKYRDIVVPPGSDAPDLPVPDDALDFTPYRADAKPVFIGHYWLPPEDSPFFAPNVVCLDHSVARNGGRLSAYRWDGEAVLDAAKIVSVPAA